ESLSILQELEVLHKTKFPYHGKDKNGKDKPSLFSIVASYINPALSDPGITALALVKCDHNLHGYINNWMKKNGYSRSHKEIVHVQQQLFKGEFTQFHPESLHTLRICEPGFVAFSFMEDDNFKTGYADGRVCQRNFKQ
ncbi:hypothetical protein HRU45_02205, partial [Candidatus Dependentiae bacterium]|nr:hypothetical protein [Candidatus Dependentiae bacterium]